MSKASPIRLRVGLIQQGMSSKAKCRSCLKFLTPTTFNFIWSIWAIVMARTIIVVEQIGDHTHTRYSSIHTRKHILVHVLYRLVKLKSGNMKQNYALLWTHYEQHIFDWAGTLDPLMCVWSREAVWHHVQIASMAQWNTYGRPADCMSSVPVQFQCAHQHS